jgi:hypothetical protein
MMARRISGCLHSANALKCYARFSTDAVIDMRRTLAAEGKILVRPS